MSLRQIRDNQDEYLSQYNSIGVPSVSELQSSENVVWVDEYTRDDGTKVKGHWRSKPESDGVPTGGAAGVDKSIDSASTTTNWKTGEKFQMNWDKNGNVYYTNLMGELLDRDVKNNQFWQQKQYEYKNKDKYPISSRFVVDAMHNFAESQKDENAEVLHGMSQLKPSVKQALLDYEVPINSSGVIYNEKSSVAKSFSNSPELKEWATNPEIQEKIKNGTLTGKDVVIHFTSNDIFSLEDFDHHSSIQHTVIVNPRIENGYLVGTLIDYYDFKKRNEKDPRNIPNNWGYEMQEKGILQNYYVCIKVRVKL